MVPFREPLGRSDHSRTWKLSVLLLSLTLAVVSRRNSDTFALLQERRSSSDAQREVDLQSASLEELQVLKKDLRVSLEKIRLPPLTSFTSFGEEYKLPFSVMDVPPLVPGEGIHGDPAHCCRLYPH